MITTNTYCVYIHTFPNNKGLKMEYKKRKPWTDEQRQRISEATKAGIRNKRSSLISLD